MQRIWYQLSAPHDCSNVSTDCYFNSSCQTIRSVDLASPQDPSERSQTLLKAWIVKLNDQNQVIVEGTLRCGQRGRTKPITKRLSSSKVVSNSKHTYHLIGNLSDPQYGLPRFVRHRFHTGFPEDWEIVVGIWEKFVTSGHIQNMKLPCKSEARTVEKKLTLTMDEFSDSHCFTEYPRTVTRVENETYPGASRDATDKLDKQYCDNTDHEEIKTKRKMLQPIGCFEQNHDQESKIALDIKKLMAWTPLLVSDRTSEYCLAFKGTLLSSTGHAVDKNHVTDAIHQRLSARIVETINRQIYELVGDLNNTKRDVPKELVTWCRYGCPKQIELFCEKLRISRLKKIELQKYLPLEERGMHHRQQESVNTCHEKLPDSIENNEPLSKCQSIKERNKRKRMLMELNDNYGTSCTGFGGNLTSNERPGAIWRKNSRVKEWLRIKRNLGKISTRDLKTTEGNGSQTNEYIRPNDSDENKQQGSAFGKMPCLSYIFHQYAPPTESVLSDGV